MQRDTTSHYFVHLSSRNCACFDFSVSNSSLSDGSCSAEGSTPAVLPLAPPQNPHSNNSSPSTSFSPNMSPFSTSPVPGPFSFGRRRRNTPSPLCVNEFPAHASTSSFNMAATGSGFGMESPASHVTSPMMFRNSSASPMQLQQQHSNGCTSSKVTTTTTASPFEHSAMDTEISAPVPTDRTPDSSTSAHAQPFPPIFTQRPPITPLHGLPMHMASPSGDGAAKLATSYPKSESFNPQQQQHPPTMTVDSSQLPQDQQFSQQNTNALQGALQQPSSAPASISVSSQRSQVQHLDRHNNPPLP